VVALALQVTASGDTPALASRELAALQPGVTVATWLANHPGEALTAFSRDSVRENDHRWCGRTSTTQQLRDGSWMVRYAYFYPPQPPPALTLPATAGPAGPALVREQCVLGTIWVQAAPLDSVSGGALEASRREALTRTYGPVRAGPDVFFGRVATDSQRRFLSRVPAADALLLGLHYFGAAGWRLPGRWQRDSTVIVSAFDRGLGDHRGRGRVLGFAHLPSAQLGSFRDEEARTEVAEDRTAALAAQAAALSGLDSARTRPLLGMLAAADSAYHDRGSKDPKVLDADAVRIMRDWTTSARDLAPPRRAAALLAADQVLGSGPMVYLRGQRHDTARVAYEELGAVFARDELGGGYNYTHNWLDEALRLDRQGPVGRLATMALLRMGFNETGMCGGGSEAFRQVIATGEQLLSGKLDPATAAELHRLVGDAYADVVALASGAGLEYADSSAYVAEAPAARSKAIAHYRRALELDRVSPEARSSWLEAWRLIAGLPPTTTHFFCVYD
jgi:hypothetical protein